MSEKRFVLDKLYHTIMTPIEKISVGRNYMTYGEVVGCLNEQQATITELESKLQAVTMLKDDYEELIEDFEKKYGKNIEDVIDDE